MNTPSAPTEDLNVGRSELLLTPQALKQRLPLPSAVSTQIAAAREHINHILDRIDHRLIVVVGPCSIHDPQAALEYAKRLAALQPQVAGSMLLVMRAYFEKPRTTTGWKGLINDPHLNDSFAIAEGLALARQLLLQFAELGLPLATEALDPITPQYLHDLISWSAIGARTAESQTHREMASGLSSAVGFKNGTDGTLGVAINALQSVASPHRFLGINQAGQVAVIETRGNPRAHIVLRGGSDGPNYSASHIDACEQALEQIDVTANIMVDCSHANSAKQYQRQIEVAEDVTTQIEQGNRSIIGLMLESHLHSGNQALQTDALEYGVSITDACIGWTETEELLTRLDGRLQNALKQRAAGTV
ncbi:MAG: 3-deoxy-7-phosphoheptulonate synthase [Pseudomonadales bacterium]